MRAEDFTTQLNEINMSPSALSAAAAKIDATVGMEFEMVIPGVGNVEDSEPEPDYGEDRRFTGLDDIEDFFAEGNSGYTVRRVLSDIRAEINDSDEYEELSEEAWDDEKETVIREFIVDKYGKDVRQDIIDKQTELTPGFGMNDEEFRATVTKKFNAAIDDLVDNALEDPDVDYMDAKEQWLQNWEPDDLDALAVEYLNNKGLLLMSDIEQIYGLTWPHYTEGGNADEIISSVAGDFAQAVKTKYVYSTAYHGADRQPNRYVVEPDSSIDTNDSDDAGLEFVSPPMSIEKMIQDLKNVYAWANRVDAYTNKSTGLHINIGLPNYSIDKLDYIKLAILVGDRYVLEQFGRISNRYATSAMTKIADKISSRAEELPNILDMLRRGMEQMASKIIHTGFTDKYTSINTKSGYIEFRSPGGDWLDQDVNKIINTLLRFVVALDAAMDPEKYRQEYLKKFYSLLAPKSEQDPIAYFAKYVAGELPQSALKSFVRQIQLQRQIKKQPAANQRYWWEVLRDSEVDNTPGIEVVASSREEALAIAARNWNMTPARLQAQAAVRALRPYESGTAAAPQTSQAPRAQAGTDSLTGR